MTAGALLYLVSACGSGEEFVAAFRRYADRNGVLFVPTAEPLTGGKRGRFAVTLKDGGVMLEGDAEVVSSSRTPSVLYGRVGMTIKFTAPDELSKVVLAELEKARLALKPSAPSVPPRPAELPGDKRPTPPAPGGRIDAVNALAECVILGELPDAAPAPVTGPGSGRVVVPPILALRAKKLTQPPTPKLDAPPPAKSPAAPPSIPSPPGSTKATSIGMPALRSPGFPPAPGPTEHGVSPPPRPPAIIDAATEPLIAPPPSVLNMPTTIDVPPPASPAHDEPTPQEAPPVHDEPKIDLNATLRGPPGAPMIAAARAAVAALELAEPTDITSPPTDEAGGEPTDVHPIPRKTSLGVAPLRPAVVEEPTPSGDWTMTPGANPTITRVPRPVPKGPPTGDWLIALDPSRPDGWTEPEKLVKRAPEGPPPGPPVSAVASSEPLDSNANTHQPEVPQGGPSIEIDPSLAATPLEASDRPSAPIPKGAFVAPLLTPKSTPAVQVSPEQHLAMLGIAPHPRALTDGGTGFFRDSGDIPRYQTEPASGRMRKRTIVIIASAAAAVVLGLVLVFALGGGDGDKQPAVSTPGSAASPAPEHGVQAPPQPAQPDPAPSPPEPAPPEPTPPEPAPVIAVPGDACEVNVTSVPPGAEIVVGGEVVGKTPQAVPLACGVDAKLTLRRARFVASTVTVTPSADNARPVKVVLAHQTLSVKVSSVPSGATITVGAKTMGVTPTMVKLPAFATSTLKISKPGYAAETQKVTPKQKNVSVHVVLKKPRRR